MNDQIGIKNSIEALLFAWGEPIDINRLSTYFEQDKSKIKEIIKILSYEYESRGLRINLNGDLVSIDTDPKYFEIIRGFGKEITKKNLTEANMETLSILAYLGPTTKSVIEQIRGVRSDVAIQNLIDKGFIVEFGRLKAPGRPFVYKTTDLFLKTFELKSFEQLPPLPDREEIKNMLQFTEINLEDIEIFNDDDKDDIEDDTIGEKVIEKFNETE